MSNRQFSESHTHKYWLRFIFSFSTDTRDVTMLMIIIILRYSPRCFCFFLYVWLYIYICECQLEFTISILEWGYILLSSFYVLSVFLSLSPSLFYSLLMSFVFFLYISRPVDKRRRSKRKRWTLLVSHISLYPSFVIVVQFYSQSMLPRISSRRSSSRLSFFCMPEIESSGKT